MFVCVCVRLTPRRAAPLADGNENERSTQVTYSILPPSPIVYDTVPQ